MSDNDPGGIRAAFERVHADDPWRRRLDKCPACEGTGRILALGFGRQWSKDRYVECWDCNGTGKGDPTEDKDITRDD